ncbi:penicillin-binding protein activator [Sphingomonas sp. LaA6.9]|uniref:penicillin-binding protein activator n=1 Tax=Sphingomonas sp. LaA6.9 TaxID=2919914 RepID=UPI001F4F612B|nr:penicillin-binding protein activator [Sphingomonas sp. LaA6.9]MCJ8159399.1 penicillin-binding protein activator [Sphingomonas sp. LaA6.9]
MAEAVLRLQPARAKKARPFGMFGVFVAGLALAGCQTMVPKGKPAPKPVTEQPDGPVGPGLPEDQLRHRVALLVPMTGSNAGVGEAIANAANLAVLDTGGKQIRMTTYDTALGAAAAAQKAIADGNKVILGPLLAEDVRVVAPIARKANVPIISFSNDASVAGDGTWLLGYNPAQSIERVVGFARTKGAASFAGLAPNGVYGQRASNAMIRAVEAAGGRMVGMQNYDRSQKSMQAAVTRLAQTSSYDALLIADSGGVAVQLAPMVRKGGGADARLLGTELWNTEGAIANSPVLRGAWFASVSDGLYSQLANKYRARYGKAPYRLSSLGYDAVLLVTRVARDWKVGTAFPARVLGDEGGFAGIDGAFRFGKDGIAQRALEVQQVDPGKFTVVSPAPKTFGN